MHDVLHPVNSESLTVENIEKCRLACLRNCSCTAFAYDNQCLIWKGDLLNVKLLPSEEAYGNEALLFRIMLEITGQLKLFIRGKEFTQWTLTWMLLLEQCDVHGSCGALASATRRFCLFVAACKDLNPKSQKIGNYKITQMAV
ncbi:hypothetical protein ACE6H2_010927 [Prunus campanulata]